MFRRKESSKSDQVQSNKPELSHGFVDPDVVNVVGTEIHGKAVDENTDSGSVSWDLKQVVYDDERNGYSIAIGVAEGKRVCAIRWNGNRPGKQIKGKIVDIGTPQSGNTAAWFVLPGFLNAAVLEAAEREKFSSRRQIEWIEGKRDSL